MNKTTIAALAALVSFAVAPMSFAQDQTTTTTTTTWSDDQGAQLNQSWTTQKYAPVTVPNLQPTVGMVVPGTVTFYPVPETIMVPHRENYEYSVINSRPVVVERTTRKVVHVW
jgi:hypothetical protein